MALLLLVLVAVDFYTSRLLRRDFLRLAFAQLESIVRITLPPTALAGEDPSLSSLPARLRGGSVRLTVVGADGGVLADSHEDPRRMANHADRPEIREAGRSDRGRAVRFSDTAGREMVYLAVRTRTAEGQDLYLRFAQPLAEVQEPASAIRMRLWGASTLVLLLAGTATILISRRFSSRLERLKEFARRVADGDFRPLPTAGESDELTDLAASLNETAGRLGQTIRLLRDERNRSAAILQSMDQGIAVVGHDESLLFFNSAFCRILKLEADRCAGRALGEAAVPAGLIDVVRRVLSSDEGARGEVAVGEQKPRFFALAAAPIRPGRNEGEKSGAVVVVHDITEIRRLERVRRDFIANVSHELKTPLTAIQGSAETLLDGALHDERSNRRFLTMISKHAARMVRLIEDLLVLSKMEAGRLEFDFAPVDVEDLLQSCLDTVRLRADTKGLRLALQTASPLPSVAGDRGRLRQVVQNLLDNAIQYTETGGSITVTASGETGAPAGKSGVTITVADTGMGIPEAHHERIFERFYRVDAARSREEGGTGLGLAIAKHIVEFHGGSIRVESRPGQGSRFHVRLPGASGQPGPTGMS